MNVPDQLRPCVTVVIPVRNEESSIAECLRGMQRQTFKDMEILIVDGMSSDGTVSIVESLALDDPRIRIIQNERRVIPAALNLGLAEAKGEFLVRFDAHSVAPPDYVERIVHHLRGGEYAGVGGTKMAVGGSSIMSRVIAAALSSRFGVGGSSYHYAQEAACVDHIPFGAYGVDLLRKMDGWNADLLANEDFELDYRIGESGGLLLLDPTVRISWKTSQRLRDFSYQYQRYGRGKAAVARLHPRSLKLRHLLPVAMFVTLGASIVVAVVAENAWFLLLDVPYLMFLLGSFSDGPFRASCGRSPWLGPVVLSTMHMSWAWGFLCGIWRKPSRSAARDTYKWRDLSQRIAQ
jgi:succinoglycan biosynthesis protein ExoA